MSKVIVSKDVGLALKDLEESQVSWTKSEIMEFHIRKAFTKQVRVVINDMETELLVKALFNGYEVESSELDTSQFDLRDKEELNKYLKEHLDRTRHATAYSYEDGVHDGLVTALRVLGIKVK